MKAPTISPVVTPLVRSVDSPSLSRSLDLPVSTTTPYNIRNSISAEILLDTDPPIICKICNQSKRNRFESLFILKPFRDKAII